MIQLSTGDFFQLPTIYIILGNKLSATFITIEFPATYFNREEKAIQFQFFFMTYLVQVFFFNFLHLFLINI